MNLENIFNDYFEKEKVTSPEQILWDEDPVTFKEFIQSPIHMNFPAYSDRQLDAMEFMFGDDPKKIFENEHYLAILAWGKGCIAPETLLEDAFTHEKYTVKELYELKKRIFISCYDEKEKTNTIEYASVPWVSGTGAIFCVETESGKKINVFKEHQFLTRSGWKRLSELSVGDEILDDYDIDLEKICNDFKKENKMYDEQVVKQYLLNKFPIKNQPKEIRDLHYSIYNKALYYLMGKNWRKQKFGNQKEKHPLWGTHCSEETKQRNRESNKKALRVLYNSERGEELRKKFSAIFSGKNNPMYGKPAPFGSGKCKYYKIQNLEQKEFYVQGKWELKFASFLNDNGISWEKNTDRFEYYTKDGVARTYCPDFKLFFEEQIIYIEIKGLEDENTDIKLKAVEKAGKKIIIIRQDIFRKFYKNYEKPILKFEKIKSITYLREDDYYDLEVDKYHNYLAHGLYNHNSGKDTVAQHATAYVVYVLLCCHNPSSLFKGVTADYIDILNVAYSYPQAINIFFAKLKNTVKNWVWLKNKYRYVDSGKSLKNDKKYEDEQVVNIKQDMIVFPKQIRAHAKCSQQNAAEGTNLLVWIADEFSAFSDKNNKSNAMEMFDTLRTSSTTRFQNYGKGFVISFTRYKNDPILKLIDMFKDDINVYTDIASTFEVKPRSAFVGEWGEWNGISMPVSFIPDFEKNPEGSKAKYLCQPPDAEDPWITETRLLEDSFEDRAAMFEFSESLNSTIDGDMIIKEITRRNFNLPDTTFVLAGDIGLTNDRSVITMFHDESNYLADGSVIKKYVQDFMLTWIPNKKENRKVDINNIEYIIKKLIFEYKVPVTGIYFDHFASSQLLTELSNKGILSQQHTLKAEDFVRFKNLLYTKAINFIKNSELEEEMKRLINGKDGKPDHPVNEHDDRFRAVCMAVSALEGFKGTDMVVTEDGIFLKGRKKMKVYSGQDTPGEAVKAQFHIPGNIDDDTTFDIIESINFRN